MLELHAKKYDIYIVQGTVIAEILYSANGK
jgi:hypothetical protein